MDMNTDTAPAPRRIDTAEVAKMIRRDNKRTFPGVKFSVRTERYSGGSSVDIFWTDGPTVDQVEKVTAAYSGRGFNGMDDSTYSKSSWYCPTHGARLAEVTGSSMGGNGPVESRCCAKAELVRMGAHYAMTHRTLSPEFRARLAAVVAERFRCDYDEHRHIDGDYMSTWLYRESRTTTG
jgi:hypothetical protein